MKQKIIQEWVKIFENVADMLIFFMLPALSIYFWGINGGGKTISFILLLVFVFKLIGLKYNK